MAQCDYEAKAVMLARRRCIICRNHQEAEKDAADRASIVGSVQSFSHIWFGLSGARHWLKR